MENIIKKESDEKINVDDIVNNLLMWLKNGLDVSDLSEVETSFLDQWQPNWKELLIFEPQV